MHLGASSSSTGCDKGKANLGAGGDQGAPERQGNVTTSTQGKSWSSLFKPQCDPIPEEDEDPKKPALEEQIPCQNQFSMFWESSCSEPSIDGERETWEELIIEETTHEVDERVNTLAPDMVNEGLNTETPSSVENSSHESNMEWASSSAVPHVEATCLSEAMISEMKFLEANVLDEANEATCFSEVMISEMTRSDLHTIVTKLIETIGEMKSSQLRQNWKILNMEQELVEANRKIRQLEYYCGTSGLSMSFPFGDVKEKQSESILLVGGFDGSSWLPNLDSYVPSEDVIQSLEPMASVRSYASSVKLNDEVYVLGGAYGSSWFDTVEAYNLKKHQWVSCPPLNRKKGSLAAACLGDKIFAIGGGNANGCFSEVEMLDLGSGKWRVCRSMVHKRYAPAAAEMNGVLYAVGGYDGQEYLESMERFDPRECSWTTLKSMSTRRGCHSLTVLNEKLFVVGGYDGAQMIPTVEVFEPRVGSWMLLEPMKYARGYFGTVTLGKTIYVLGGMQENDAILDTIECYSEGTGWQLTDLKAVGKRCFLSAVV